ncbi:hypothetical protein [Anaerolinea thermophila]|uniref:hypothetical protein n=1 Tax=Anaerolinea thermophila TaxID=167964 RepID=UPI00263828F5|nr:hypothetical protein [Anaerolinea thermophila]
MIFVILLAIRIVGGKPLGIRSFVEIQIWKASALVRSLQYSKEIQSLSQGNYTNVIFLHHSVGDNLIRQTDYRDRLTQAGLSFWDHDYNYYGLNDPNGQNLGFHFNIPNDDTDPPGLAKLFSQPVYPLPINAVSGLMQYEVIILKSCFTGNVLPDDQSVEKTRTYYEVMHRFFEKHPEKLFILLTTPPLNSAEADEAMGARAREIAEWLQSPEYLRGLPNVYVFDLYSALAENDPSSPNYNRLREDYKEGTDNHPTMNANQDIAPVLAEFIVDSINDFRAKQTGVTSIP